MSILEIWLLAISLAMDCFSVSITSGMILRRICWRTFLTMAFFFGLFQALMPLIGSLSDAVMLKDNHIAAGGGILSAVSKVRANIPHTVKIEVEVENMDMVREAVESGADIIMLDNMNEAAMAEAVKYIDGRALVEASGDVTEERMVAIAQTGVDIISIGRITHSVKAMDISLRFKI